MQAHWESALTDLRSMLSAETFETWLAPIRWRGCEGHTLRLLIPNKFHAEWIQSHYLSTILGLMRDKSGIRSIDVRWEVDQRPVIVGPSKCRAPAALPPTAAMSSCASTNLNGKYHFERFVVGPCNELAHAASIAAAANPGARYNPLFIHGGVGLGKTHLLNAIGHRVLDAKPNARIVYASAEHFTNDFIAAVKNHKMGEFRDTYRTRCDVLLLDDIQFLASREKTLEEFFHTFNALYHADKQIVISSDVDLQHMKDMKERFVSLFHWGLAANIGVPERDTRVAIVKRKAQLTDLDLPDDVAQFIAETVRSNVRALEGTLLTLAMNAALLKRPIDLACAREALQGTNPPRESLVTVEDIQRTVCEYFRINMSELKSPCRQRSVVQPRMVAMYLCRQRLNTSYTQIGERFGGRDHTTVASAVHKIEARILSHDAESIACVQVIQERLNRA